MQETCLDFDHTFYTTATNNILSKNIALESLLVRMVDHPYDAKLEAAIYPDHEVLEAALSLILEQGKEIGGFRSVCDRCGLFASELIRITSKNFGAGAMTERLINEGDKSGDLVESLISLIQSQFTDIQKIRNTLSQS